MGEGNKIALVKPIGYEMPLHRATFAQKQGVYAGREAEVLFYTRIQNH